MAASAGEKVGRVVLPPYLRELLENPDPVLTSVGLFLDREMRQAFPRRSFGGVAWPAQYEGQDEPWIHFAGALNDLRRSSTVKSRRFAPKQPLQDSGLMFNSIKSRPVSRFEVEAGVLAHIDYAGKHNEPGGESSIPITPGMRKNLQKATRKATGKKKKALRKLGFIWATDVFSQSIAWRPFVGITDRARRSIPKIVESIFEGKPAEQTGRL